MRRWLLSLGVLVASAAIAENALRISPRFATVALGTSAAAPTVNPNLTATAATTAPSSHRSTGVPGALHLTGCYGYRITMCAPTGQTLSGAGSAQVYYYADYGTVSWSRNPGIDEAVSVISTSCAGAACQCQTFPDRALLGLSGGWIYVAPSSVTMSGGTSVTVTVEATCAY